MDHPHIIPVYETVWAHLNSPPPPVTSKAQSGLLATGPHGATALDLLRTYAA